MIYVSIDTETTSLTPSNGQIIQFGAIIEDTDKKLSYDEIPKFEVLLEHTNYIGEPFPLQMHQALFKRLADVQHKTPEEKEKAGVIPAAELAERFALFLSMNGVDPSKAINVAGKNFGTFDWPFLMRLSQWKQTIKMSQRILDPAILFWDPAKDKRLPNLEECKTRMCLPTTTVAHTCLPDAWDVIELLRTKYL